MKKVLVIIGIFLCIAVFTFRAMLVEAVTATTAPVEDVREGDVIFQTSLSAQSPLIKIGTRSSITHCGIIVMKNGDAYVLETLQTLVLTSFTTSNKLVQWGKH